MDDLVKVLTRVSDTIKALLYQFEGQPNMAAIAASYGVQFQELEDVFFDLYLLRALATATGEQLNQIGIIVDEPRGDKDDDNYRAAIYGRIALNRSHGRIEDIIDSMTAILDNTYVIRELGNLYSLDTSHIAVMVTLEDAKPSAIDATTFNDALQKIKPGGVHAHFHYSDYDNDDTFTFADGDVEQTDADKGWGNDSETAGGYWSDVVE
jgi:hypothetical protein